MNAPSIDIAEMIIDSSSDYVIGDNLFIGREPNSPHNVITIIDSYGYAPQLTYNRTEKYESPSVQILIRNMDYRTAFENATNIVDLLHGLANITINDTYYSVIRAMGSPALLGWDDNGRCRFSLNFDIQRR